MLVIKSLAIWQLLDILVRHEVFGLTQLIRESVFALVFRNYFKVVIVLLVYPRKTRLRIVP